MILTNKFSYCKLMMESKIVINIEIERKFLMFEQSLHCSRIYSCSGAMPHETTLFVEL